MLWFDNEASSRRQGIRANSAPNVSMPAIEFHEGIRLRMVCSCRKRKAVLQVGSGNIFAPDSKLISPTQWATNARPAKITALNF
jgi:hypothetical protein